MKGEYLSCKAWIDENGTVHRTKAEAIKYQKWQPGKFSLGKNYAERIDEIIEECAEEIRINLCYTKDGELVPKKLETFKQKVKPNLERQARNKLAKYERHCTRLRKTHRMNPFAWQMETEDRIREQIIGKGRLPRLQNLDPEKLREKYTKEELWPGFPGPAPTKAEYQGDNDPLEQNQVKRQAHEVGPSKRAQAALEHYEKTGKLIVPDRNTAKWDQEIEKWEAEMPICTKPIKNAEPINQIYSEVRKKLKKRLKLIEDGVWTEISGPKHK